MISKLFRAIKNPKLFVLKAASLGWFNWMDDATYLKMIYRLKMGRSLDLDNPKTFNEKLQWLKLHDRKPEYTTMVDKYAVKKYVADIIGEEYIIPTLGKWDRFDDIDFDALPNQFVLKCNHDSGSWVIVKDKNKFDKNAAKRKLESRLKRNLYWIYREWPYKNVKPCIIAEQYLENPEYHYYDRLRDYKFFCFGGEPKIVLIANDVNDDDARTDFFDMDYNVIKMKTLDPNSDNPFPKPICFEEMKEIARKLSKGISHVRVDMYVVDGKIYFGELTFFHLAGFANIQPPEWDMRMGEWINLVRSSEFVVRS